MGFLPPKKHTYQKEEAILVVGIDRNGRVFSDITKNGQVVAKDLFIKFPMEAQLAKQGWKRISNE